MSKKDIVVIFVRENDFMGMEEAILQSQHGNLVYLIACDSSVGVCHRNPYASSLRCEFCAYTTSKIYDRYIKSYKNIKFLRMSSLLSTTMKKQAEEMTFNYSNVRELKDLTFHGVEIGYGAFSTFATATRNVMPEFNDSFHNYIDMMLRQEVEMTLAIEELVKNITPSLIVFHNGRFNNFKPWYWIAKNRGISFIATETRTDPDGTMLKDNFVNDIPHSFKAMTEKIEKGWQKLGDRGEVIGKSFFENRRNAKPAGDKIYVKDQVSGLMPDGFDSSIYNVGIFNSSEDEFCSVSKENDDSSLYPNQYIALTTLFEHYKNDSKIHFYLRIHPNLKDVPFKSHMLLYELDYPNVTIIPPTSPISSYTLMDNVDKVIVFDSTMGMESTYWGKPVIALCRCFYSDLDLVYHPHNSEEFFKLIDDKALPSKRNDINCYKGACFCMNYGAEEFVYLKNKISHRVGEIYTLKKFMGSSLLQAVVTRIIEKVSLLYGNGKKYKNLAKETA